MLCSILQTFKICAKISFKDQKQKFGGGSYGNAAISSKSFFLMVVYEYLSVM